MSGLLRVAVFTLALAVGYSVFCQMNEAAFCQTNEAATGIDPRLGAALKTFCARCGSVKLGADPDRSFAHWTDAEANRKEPTGWREYRVKERPWDLWYGSYEGADIFNEPDGLLVNMWASSDSGDWGESTYYCFGADGKARAVFMSSGEVPEAQIAFLEKQINTSGHFGVTRRDCYATDAKYFGSCKETLKSLEKGMRTYSSKKQLPFASLLAAGK